MATWDEFALGAADVRRSAHGLAPADWQPFAPGAASLAAAGRRLLARGEIALLGTVSRAGRPRIHPFIPRIIDGRLCAFIVETSPKMRDLLHRRYVVHAIPGDDDEEFWVSGRARRIDDAGAIARVGDAMPYTVRADEVLFEFDLELVGWTVWTGFGTDDIKPQHHRWRAADG